MTYRDLKEYLEQIESSQLDCDVTIYLCELAAFIPVNRITETEHTDILDPKHPYLVVGRETKNRAYPW